MNAAIRPGQSDELYRKFIKKQNKTKKTTQQKYSNSISNYIPMNFYKKKTRNYNLWL
jgi:hypothetical protein